MRDKRLLSVLVVAVIVAIGSGLGVYSVLVRAKEDSRIPTVGIVVASTDLPEGHLLTKADARMSLVPRSAVPHGAFMSADSLVGRVTRVNVMAGDALVPGRLAPAGAGAGLEVKITPGKRAMAVKIDEVAGLSGLIQPNSRVDVLVTVREDAANAQERAKLFMSNMRVLSVGSQLERGPDGKPQNATTATLEVTPSEAEQLAIATNQGKIQLVLRGFGDPDTVATTGASISDMMRAMGMAAPARSIVITAPATAPTPARINSVTKTPAAAPAAAPAPRVDSAVVQVYRGDKISRQRFDKADTSKS